MTQINIYEILDLIEEGKQIAMPISVADRFLVELSMKKVPFYLRAHEVEDGALIVFTKFDAELNIDGGGRIML